MTQTASSTDPKVLVQRLLAPIADDMKAVDDYIRAELASDVSRMHEISEYITSAGGKRMRPALLILISRALGYKGDLCCYLGATIELLHTATLMHDDVVDESNLRRGRPTANARWGNGAAVLVGDFLYTRSFQMMVRAGNLRVMQAATLWPRQGMTVEMFEQDMDNVQKNLVTIRAERRLGFGVERPKALCGGDLVLPVSTK